MEIIRHDDGSLTIPVAVAPVADENAAEDAGAVVNGTTEDTPIAMTTMVLRPGEGGYLEALAKWDLEQDPSRGEAVSTVSGREEAMHVVHVVADDPGHVADAVNALDDAQASAEALRHVLVGGTPSVTAFASEVADAEGGDPLKPHTATKLIGEVLAEIDNRDS